ncbi:MAG: D-tyrosyl-tRNA(Tyr) deacylase [Spirochaetes bacterium]|nr:D-tyrosyl-tRNA(Tyr) deacylase [Spirochaetota bacterium]
MKFVIQRVKEAAVHVDGATVAEIRKGLLVFVGLEKGDTAALFPKAIDKIAGMRIFSDENDKMNLSVNDIGGEVLLVSQFTLAGDISKGKRPSYDNAMPVEEARTLYASFVDAFTGVFPRTKNGCFQAMMDVRLVNDGPVTIIYELN